MKVIVTVAASLNNVIGCNGQLPWHAPSDLKRFKEATMNACVLMGRKTWDSLPPKKLPGRLCNVVTSQKIERETEDSYIGVFHDVTYAVDILSGIMRRNPQLKQELHIIGGNMVLAEAFAEDLVDEIRLTRIYDVYNGDVLFNPYWLNGFYLFSDTSQSVQPGEPNQSIAIYRKKEKV